jgi:hypothetical protein
MRPWQLFVTAVLVWGTTWHAIHYQLPHVTPEVGVALRFGLAGAGLLLIAVAFLAFNLLSRWLLGRWHASEGGDR